MGKRKAPTAMEILQGFIQMGYMIEPGFLATVTEDRVDGLVAKYNSRYPGMHLHRPEPRDLVLVIPLMQVWEAEE